MMLGDMGADIIKVERPGYGDDTRMWGPPFTSKGHESAYFLSVNRNKRSITVDMKHPEGLDIIRKLAKVSDIVIENFAPGDALKLGLDRSEFFEKFPHLIWCSITGYGPDGPLSNRLGYAVLVEAHSGLMNCTGPRDGDPVKSGVAMTDILTGLHACTGILAALYQRKNFGGKGSIVDCSLLESQVSAMSNVASNWLIANQESQRLGTEHPSIVPYGTYRTMDGRIAIAAGNDRQFQALCRCLGIPEIAEDVRFKTNSDRVINKHACIEALENVFKTRPSCEWISQFDKLTGEKKFAFAPVNNMEQVFSDPQVIHRDMILECEHATAGRIRLPGVPIKFSQTESTQVRYSPPVLGQHTREILTTLLGMSDSDVDELVENRIVT
jgi:succinate--hydroxymethylglutarate CoA-transferase